ncbi:unnamed protein product [Microthlaspi erraticum]|uniref:DUF4283 domain-containing protein n=1 Tax=Microthlaspi erraticum TaxID=1685480 RepID=A0A6D2JU87_9BRAS|nr:unnamed protein product [Microthlaspi erraticum]
MVQGNLIGGEVGNKANKKPAARLKITVPRFDNSELIRGYSRTLIGRCMNLAAQDVQALLHHMPRFWKMEERVAGADLGMGRFQFDFDKEEDIKEVFKLEPFHFDYWMVSLVRWERVMEATYPSAIKFWVRMMGIPLHFWAEPTFRSIGEAIGEVIEVDIDGGRVRVCLDGYKPLVFETTVEFHSGEETVVALRYERLFGWCCECSSLCHDVLQCPDLRRAREERDNQRRRDEKPDNGAQSYKCAVLNGSGGENTNLRQPSNVVEGDIKGKGKVTEMREDKGKRVPAFRGNGKHGGESSGSHRRPAGYVPPEQRKRVNRPTGGFRNLAIQPAAPPAIVSGTRDPSPSQHSAKKVRKALDFSAVEAGLDDVRTKPDDAVAEKVGENDFPATAVPAIDEVVPMVEGVEIQEEGEDGEIWWNEVTEGEETEKAVENIEEQAEPEDGTDMQMEESEQGSRLDVKQYVEVEAKEVGKGKQAVERKVGAKKKTFRTTVGGGGGPLRRMIQGGKTPRRKAPMSVKDTRKGGDKGAGKELEENPSEGSATMSKIG